MNRNVKVVLVAAPVAIAVGIGVAVASSSKANTTFSVKDSCHGWAKDQITADPHPKFSSETVKATGVDKKTGLPRYLLSGHVAWTDLTGAHQTLYGCEVLVDKPHKKVLLSDLEIPGT